MTGTYNAVGRDGEPTHGGYSGAIVVDENYVLRIPDALPLDAAAPLLCAGITTYSPLRHWNAGPGDAVAVIGLGGLGHMGVKLATAMGAKVTVLSQSLKKMEDGLRLGADEYYATSDPETFTKLAGSFRPDPEHGVGQPGYGRLPEPARRRRHAGRTGHARTSDGGAGCSRFCRCGAACPGSMIGGIAETQEMLDFCAEHGVTPEIEVVAPDYINEAYERVLASDVRYRFVIDTQSLRS